MSKSFFVLFLMSALYLPALQACEQLVDNEAEQLLTIVKNVNDKSADTESYQFSVDNCWNSGNQYNEHQISHNPVYKNIKSVFHQANQNKS